MNKVEMMYKADTGNSAHLTGIEARLMVEPLDVVMLEGLTDKEICELIQYDNKNNMVWCVGIKEIPQEFTDGDDLYLINPDYIKWLEEKVESLQKFPGNNI